MSTLNRNKPIALVAVALALVAILGLRAYALQEEEGTCASDEACSDQFAENPAVQQSWEEGLSYEVSAGGEGSRITSDVAAEVQGCTVMTLRASATLQTLASLCLTGGADPETVWLYTLVKLAASQGDGGFVSDANAAGGFAEPSGSATDPTTATTLSSAPDPSSLGESVVLTATITHPAPGTPAGAVEFFSGGILLGTAPVSGGSLASLSTSALSVGSHSLGATYTGDGFYGASTGTDTHLVERAETTTLVAASSLQPSPCDSLVFTATVSMVSPAAPPATGLVEFFDGFDSLGTASLSGNPAQASIASAALSAGSHSITAVYLGSANSFGSLSPAITVVVNAPGTDLSVFSTNGTTSAERSELAGVVEADTIRNFAIPGIASGWVQDRVLRSDATGELHFYWRVHNDGPGTINFFVRSGFAGSTSSVPDFIDYRPDGLGDVPPDEASFESALQTDGGIRFFSSATGVNNDIGPGQESRFIFVLTTATQFNSNGCGVIYAGSSSVAIPAHRPQ